MEVIQQYTSEWFSYYFISMPAIRVKASLESPYGSQKGKTDSDTSSNLNLPYPRLPCILVFIYIYTACFHQTAQYFRGHSNILSCFLLSPTTCGTVLELYSNTTYKKLVNIMYQTTLKTISTLQVMRLTQYWACPLLHL